MSKKKLAIILSRFPFPLDKGDKLRAYQQIKYLSDFFDIQLYSLETKTTTEENKKQLLPYCSSIHTYQLKPWSIAYQAFRSFFRSEPVQVGYFFSKEIYFSIRKDIGLLQPDVVFAQLSRTAHFAVELPFPKLLDFQDAFSLNYERVSKESGGIRRWFYAREGKCMRYFEKWIIKKFDATTIISEIDKQAIDASIHVIPNGVETSRFLSLSLPKKYDLLFLGNLSYLPNRKAVEFLAHKVLPQLQIIKPDIRVQIVGAGLTDSIRKLATAQLHITGWVEDSVTAYNECRLFVAPLFSGAGMQNKVLEAMSCGLPVITTPIVNASIQAQDTKEILIASGVDEFVKHITTLLDDKKYSEQVGQSAREFVEKKFQWSAANEKLRQLLMILCENSNRAQ